MQRYTDEAQMQSYLSHCREKAFQLKRMSDRLFEYFLVYGKRERQYHFQLLSCESLLEDLCNSQFFDWQEQGGISKYTLPPSARNRTANFRMAS